MHTHTTDDRFGEAPGHGGERSIRRYRQLRNCGLAPHEALAAAAAEQRHSKRAS